MGHQPCSFLHVVNLGSPKHQAVLPQALDGFLQLCLQEPACLLSCGTTHCCGTLLLGTAVVYGQGLFVLLDQSKHTCSQVGRKFLICQYVHLVSQFLCSSKFPRREYCKVGNTPRASSSRHHVTALRAAISTAYVLVRLKNHHRSFEEADRLLCKGVIGWQSQHPLTPDSSAPSLPAITGQPNSVAPLAVHAHSNWLPRPADQPEVPPSSLSQSSCQSPNRCSFVGPVPCSCFKTQSNASWGNTTVLVDQQPHNQAGACSMAHPPACLWQAIVLGSLVLCLQVDVANAISSRRLKASAFCPAGCRPNYCVQAATGGGLQCQWCSNSLLVGVRDEAGLCMVSGDVPGQRLRST